MRARPRGRGRVGAETDDENPQLSRPDRAQPPTFNDDPMCSVGRCGDRATLLFHLSRYLTRPDPVTVTVERCCYAVILSSGRRSRPMTNRTVTLTIVPLWSPKTRRRRTFGNVLRDTIDFLPRLRGTTCARNWKHDDDRTRFIRHHVCPHDLFPTADFSNCALPFWWFSISRWTRPRNNRSCRQYVNNPSRCYFYATLFFDRIRGFFFVLFFIQRRYEIFTDIFRSIARGLQ